MITVICLTNTVLGKLPMDYHMRLDPTVPPVVCSARKIVVAMKQDVINELEHMKNIGVIEAVTEPTEWVSSMVAAKKKMAVFVYVLTRSI